MKAQTLCWKYSTGLLNLSLLKIFSSSLLVPLQINHMSSPSSFPGLWGRDHHSGLAQMMQRKLIHGISAAQGALALENQGV